MVETTSGIQGERVKALSKMVADDILNHSLRFYGQIDLPVIFSGVYLYL